MFLLAFSKSPQLTNVVGKFWYPIAVFMLPCVQPGVEMAIVPGRVGPIVLTDQVVPQEDCGKVTVVLLGKTEFHGGMILGPAWVER